MKARIALVAALVAVLTYGATALLASPAKAPGVTRIRLVEHEIRVAQIDLAAHGYSVGDRSSMQSGLRDAKGKSVGRLDADCLVTGIRARLGGLCHEVLTLAGGQITAQYAYGKTGEARLQAITGGSGKYEGARGQLIVAPDNPKGTPIVVELLR